MYVNCGWLTQSSLATISATAEWKPRTAVWMLCWEDKCGWSECYRPRMMCQNMYNSTSICDGVTMKMPRMRSCFLDHEIRKTIVESSGSSKGAIILTCPSGRTAIAPLLDNVDPVCRVSQAPAATERHVDFVSGVPEPPYTILSAHCLHLSVFEKGRFRSMRFQAPRKIEIIFHLRGKTPSTPLGWPSALTRKILGLLQ